MSSSCLHTVSPSCLQHWLVIQAKIVTIVKLTVIRLLAAASSAHSTGCERASNHECCSPACPQYSQQELQAEILETEKLLAAREQQGGLSRKELREVQEVRAQIARAKQELQQQQQQQQQRQDGTMYGIPVAPQSETLPPYSEAVRGLDDMLVRDGIGTQLRLDRAYERPGWYAKLVRNGC
eukprot:1161190-Pelagomonas_calceolata.AAC.11